MPNHARRHLVLALAALPLAARAAATPAAPPELAGELPDARLQGQGRFTYFGLHVYDARLWVGPGFAAEAFERHPLALELQYGRGLEGRQIAERSLAEMKKVGTVTAPQAERWLTQMTQAFPDVAKDDRITGVLHPAESARFFMNGKPRADIRDPDFARLFFSIWLSARTSEPTLRQALVGGARDRP